MISANYFIESLIKSTFSHIFKLERHNINLFKCIFRIKLGTYTELGLLFERVNN
jgi:hypothetical protein